MMPPKKSRAARTAKETVEEPEPVENNNEPEAPAVQESSQSKSTKAEPVKVKKFMWEDELMEGKRKRLMPLAEQKLHDWLTEHLEERDETKVIMSDVYNTYLEGCISCAESGVDQFTFTKIIHQRFPKGYGIKPSSTYADAIKEKKPRKKVATKVKADTLKLKLRDLIENCLNELKNPRKGIRFHTIKQHIAMRYPALRLDVRPQSLKNALEKGIRFGYIIRVKGIGAAGFYRLPGGPEEEEAEDEKVKKDNEDGKKEGEDKEDEAKEKADGEEADEEKDNKEEGGDESEKGKKTEKATAKKNKPKKKTKKAAPKTYRSQIVHSDPERIEDTFPLAMTFMAEPKEASVGRIKRYLEKNYQVSDLDTKLKKAMVAGSEKGFWQQVSGTSPYQGSYRLLVDEFDPTDDDDIIGKVVNAIMACHEPKECSANLLKRYVLEYHPDFKVQEKPFLFKKALERAIKKNIIRQVTGIGATGTFQLVKQFHPMPIILAGADTASDYEYDSEDDQPVLEAPDVSYFQDSYIPRPSSSRGHGRQGAAGIDRFSDLKFDPRYRKTSADNAQHPIGGRGRNDFFLSDFTDAYVPRPTSRGHARKASKGVNRFTEGKVVNQPKSSAKKKVPSRSPKKPKYAESSDSESDTSDSDSESSSEDEAPPPPPKKKRGPPRDRSAPPTKAELKAPVKGRAKARGKTQSKPKISVKQESPEPEPRGPPVKTPAAKKAMGRSRRR